MEGKTGKCPVCGCQTPIPDDRDDFFCISCGKSLHIERHKKVESSARSAMPEMKEFSIVDPSSGMPLASVTLPGTFKVQGSILPNVSCSVYPIEMMCAAFDPMGTAMTFFTGEGFTDSSSCAIMNGPYAQPLNRVNKIVYRNFMDGVSYAEEYMRKFTAGSKAENLRFVENRELPIEGYNPQKALEMYKFLVERDMHRSGVVNLPPVLDWYIEPVCRIYEFIIGGRLFRCAIVFLLEAVKCQMLPEVMPSVSNLFGGLLGKKKTIVKQDGSGFAVMPNNAAIEWKSDGIFMLQTVPEVFDVAFNNFFRQFCSSFRISQQFLQRTEQLKDKINEDIAAVTQANLAQQRAQFAAWQQANATRQAAFDAANQAWWERSNASFASSRASCESSEDRMSRLRSEAIRGVNTYTRDDGSETEVSVDYDRAYTNVNHDTLGSNSAFEPGGNWTEMNRK